MKVAGFVTAGGRSSRMNQDKALLKIGDKTLIERVIAALRPVTSSVAIIANDPSYKKFDLPVFSDTHPGFGPLEAIRTALVNTSAPRVALVACDMPFVTSELLAFLLDQAEDYDAVVPLNRDGMPEPLCALYSIRAMSAACGLIEAGNLKTARLFDLVNTRLVVFEEVRHFPRSELFFENINTPEDYARAIKLAGAK